MSEHSELFSLTPAPTSPEGTLLLRLEIPGRLPSWNDILGMEQWARYKFKGELAAAFLSALRASGYGSSMKITCAKNIMSIYADTLASYLAMKQARRELKSRKGKPIVMKKKKSSSKSMKSPSVTPPPAKPPPAPALDDSPFD